jgi:hypothetical protein
MPPTIDPTAAVAYAAEHGRDVAAGLGAMAALVAAAVVAIVGAPRVVAAVAVVVTVVMPTTVSIVVSVIVATVVAVGVVAAFAVAVAVVCAGVALAAGDDRVDPDHLGVFVMRGDAVAMGRRIVHAAGVVLGGCRTRGGGEGCGEQRSGETGHGGLRAPGWRERTLGPAR